MPDGRPSLCSLLSHALVAYTIEADNLFESRAPHLTSAGRVRGGGPWLVSMAMWLNCLRHLRAGPLTVEELYRAAKTRTNVDGMRRWGHIAIDTQGRHVPGRDSILSLTAGGRMAEAVWASVVAEVEDRWRGRHARYAEFRQALEPIGQALTELPGSMPLLGYGFYTRENAYLPSWMDSLGSGPDTRKTGVPRAPGSLAHKSTAEIIAQLLVRIAVSFENGMGLSLAMYLDVLAVLGSERVAVRDLARKAGISKAAVAMATGYLTTRDLAVAHPATPTTPASISLTEGILRKLPHYRAVLDRVEWYFRKDYDSTKFKEVLAAICENLQGGLVPVPGGWRTTAPARLPDFPMTLHRGGYPDGA